MKEVGDLKCALQGPALSRDGLPDSKVNFKEHFCQISSICHQAFFTME
jgi:hypothetical protein